MGLQGIKTLMNHTTSTFKVLISKRERHTSNNYTILYNLNDPTSLQYERSEMLDKSDIRVEQKYSETTPNIRNSMKSNVVVSG